MVSFRFPFSFSQVPKPPPSAATNASSRPVPSTAVVLSIAVAATAAGAGIAAISNNHHRDNAILQSALNFLNRSSNCPIWGSISLSESSSPVTEPRTGTSFPTTLRDTQRLLGVGLRRKAILGLKNIDVYAFGVYAHDVDVRRFLSGKVGEVSISELKDSLMESDITMTIRLQIVYGRLSIRSVRNAFEESVGSRLRKFGGSDNKELLQRFTSQFKDEYKIPKGSIIDLSKERGHILRTTIDGEEIGCLQSKLLCKSILDLYIGNEPFDQKAKEDVELSLVSLAGK